MIGLYFFYFLLDSGFSWVFISFYAYSRLFTMPKFLLKNYN
jgi:hypothetical protein